MPEGWMDRDYYGATTLHPLGLLAILILGALLLFLPRRYAIFPIILMACLVPSAQRLVVFSLDFTLLRIMILTGWMRLLYRNELADFTWKPLDTVVVLWAASGTLVYTILWQDASQFIYILGTIFDAVGAYFLFRALINNWGDVDRAAWIFTVISLPVAVAFLIEHTTGRNAFAFLGGVPEITMQRADRLRCQGAFSHPIIAGCFWVSVLPLIAAGLWARHRNRILVIAGIIATLVIIYTCASSTPVTSLLFCLIGAAFFLVRRRMRVIRWGLLLGLVGLHLFMKAPVWHLLSRIDFTGGSTGYHRYVLIDQAINNLNTWWLKGTRSTADWDEVQGLWDITNQYVYEGVNGGLITLVLFRNHNRTVIPGRRPDVARCLE